MIFRTKSSPFRFHSYSTGQGSEHGLIRVKAVLRIRVFLGLPDPRPDPLVTSMGPDPDTDPSIIKQNYQEKPWFIPLYDFFMTFYLRRIT